MYHSLVPMQPDPWHSCSRLEFSGARPPPLWLLIQLAQSPSNASASFGTSFAWYTGTSPSPDPMIPEVVRVPMHQRYLRALVAADGAEHELSAVPARFAERFPPTVLKPLSKRGRARASPLLNLLADPGHGLPLFLVFPGSCSTKEVRRRWKGMGGRPRCPLFWEVAPGGHRLIHLTSSCRRKLDLRDCCPTQSSSVQRVQLRRQFLYLFLKIFHGRGSSSGAVLVVDSSLLHW